MFAFIKAGISVTEHLTKVENEGLRGGFPECKTRSRKMVETGSYWLILSHERKSGAAALWVYLETLGSL